MLYICSVELGNLLRYKIQNSSRQPIKIQGTTKRETLCFSFLFIKYQLFMSYL